MALCDVYRGMGEESLGELLKSVSIGKLKTYQLYERLKLRFRLVKLNSESLRKARPQFWKRISEGDEEFASDLAQAVLVSHLDMIVAVLNELGIPHNDGFFDKDLDAGRYLTEGWKERVFEKLRGAYPDTVLLFYLNHLGWEVAKSSDVFAPAA
jgi:hypothetical protein